MKTKMPRKQGDPGYEERVLRVRSRQWSRKVMDSCVNWSPSNDAAPPTCSLSTKGSGKKGSGKQGATPKGLGQ